MTWRDLVKQQPKFAELAVEAEQAGENNWGGWWRWVSQQRFYVQLVGTDPVRRTVAADHLRRIHGKALLQRGRAGRGDPGGRGG